MEGLIGNEKFKVILNSWLNSGKLPHSIMLEGDRGLGKHTAARYLIESILCRGEGEKPCGKCRECELLRAGSHPDFKVIAPKDGKSYIPVKEIRELKTMAYDMPDRGGKKIYLIEAENGLKADAQNTLLKLLEEPPEFDVFIILTKSSSFFLDTVISRCAIIELLPPKEAEALEFLKESFPEKIEDEILSVLVFNDNNLGKAIAQMSGDIGEIPTDAQLILKAISGKRAYEVLRLLSKYERNQKDFSSLISILEASAEIGLRRAAMGQTSPLSKEDFIRLKERIKVAKKYLNKFLPLGMLIPQFCASIFEE